MAMRTPVKTKRSAAQQITRVYTIPAPTRGWNARDPEANMAKGFAIQLENWWPRTNQVEVRHGAADHATGLSTAVLGLMSYHKADGTDTLFASTDAGIYNATAAGAVGAASSAVTNGKCLAANFNTTGGSFMFVVNGTDSLRYYDGTSWTVVASYAINGGGTLNSNTISNLNVFKRMLFFIEKNSMNFYYLPVDAITGNVSRFPLGGLFAAGGNLVAMGTWTIDGGAGVDDYAVFVTSEGQVAVYKGTDPSNASTWALQGVYDLSAPLGPKCFMKFAGDLLYLSRDGLYPLSKALLSTAIITKAAVTNNISGAFSEAAGLYGGNYGWQAIYSLQSSILIVNIPTVDLSEAQQFAMNTITGAWAKFTGWNGFCWEIMGEQLYLGMVGKVAKAWYGANDFGGVIPCYAKTNFDRLGSNQSKFVPMVRPTIKIGGSVSVSVAIDMDFAEGTEYGSAVFNSGATNLFDSALWVADGGSGATWEADATPRLDWLTVGTKPGFWAAARLRCLAADATVGWTATDFAVQDGGLLS